MPHRTVTRTFPLVYLVAHAETAWTLTGQQMGTKDLPLSECGERNALRLKERLRDQSFAKVLSGPSRSMLRTCELAGFAAAAEIDQDLREWHLGSYEGHRLSDILRERPAWMLFRDGCPGGELPAAAAQRLGRVVDRLRSVDGHVLVFSSLNVIRTLAACWISLEDLTLASRFMLNSASLSAIGYEHSYSNPVIVFWNDTHHIGE